MHGNKPHVCFNVSRIKHATIFYNCFCTQKYAHKKKVRLKHPKHIMKLMGKTLFEMSAIALFSALSKHSARL